MTAAPLLVGVAVDTRLTGITVRDHTDLTGHARLPYTDSAADWLTQVTSRITSLADDRAFAVVLKAWPPVPAYNSGGHTHAELLHALLTGWILARGWELRQVATAARYGSWLRDGYPPELFGVREHRPFPHGRLWLCRNAWDLTGAALPHGTPTINADRAGLLEQTTVHVARGPWPNPNFHQHYAAQFTATCPFDARPSSYCWVGDRPVPHGEDLPVARQRYQDEVIGPHVDKHLRERGRAGCLVTATYRGWPA